MTQPDFLGLLFHKSERAKRAPRFAARMIAVLHVAREWVTRREFNEKHGFSKDGRECRLGCAASHGRIIAGQKGYKLTKYAAHEEIANSLASIMLQIKAEKKRYSMLCRRAHLMVHEGEKGAMRTI